MQTELLSILSKLYDDEFNTMTLDHGYDEPLDGDQFIDADDLAAALAGGHLGELLATVGCEWLDYITAQDVLHCLEPDNPKLEDVCTLVSAMFVPSHYADWCASAFDGIVRWTEVESFLDQFETELVEQGKWDYGLTNTYVFLCDHLSESELILAAMAGDDEAKGMLAKLFMEANC